MKKIISILLLFIIAAQLSACSTTTITDKPGNFIYSQNEEINIIDIDSRESLGIVKVTGCAVLKDAPFVLQEYDGKDENGKEKYKEVSYAQIIQVYYTYSLIDGSKNISATNFTVFDSSDAPGRYDPETDYSRQDKKDNPSFILALKNKSSYVNINFKYRPLQTKETAKIRIDL